MDVIKYFNTKKRMCEFHKGTCHLCPMGKDNTKTHLLCFELQQEKPEIADAIVEPFSTSSVPTIERESVRRRILKMLFRTSAGSVKSGGSARWRRVGSA